MLDMDLDFIKKRLVEEGYTDNTVTSATAERLLSLTGDSASMLKKWLEDGTVPTFSSINGVDSIFLSDKLKMKAPALIIAYAMLNDNPKDNAAYFKKLADNIIGFYPNLPK